MEAGFKLKSLLSLPPEGWDYRHVPTCIPFLPPVLGIKPRTLSILGNHCTTELGFFEVLCYTALLVD
jgi:hypothetical protein